MFMSHDLLATIALLLAFLVLIVITNYLYNRYKWASENSRKFIHVAGGFLCLFGFRFISSHWYVLILCSIAFVILLVSFIKKSLPSIHETKRVSFGSILFPIPVYACFVVSKYWGNDLFFYVPVSLLTVSDTLAEWGGNKWGERTISFFHKQKTLAGSLCFGISSFIICLLLLYYFNSFPIGALVIYSFLCMLITTIAELVTLKGFDNLTIPASAMAVLYFIA